MRDIGTEGRKSLVTLYGGFAVGTLFLAACFAMAAGDTMTPTAARSESASSETAQFAPAIEHESAGGRFRGEEIVSPEVPREFADKLPDEMGELAGSAASFEEGELAMPPESFEPEAMQPVNGSAILP